MPADDLEARDRTAELAEASSRRLADQLLEFAQALTAFDVTHREAVVALLDKTGDELKERAADAYAEAAEVGEPVSPTAVGRLLGIRRSSVKPRYANRLAARGIEIAKPPKEPPIVDRTLE